MSVGVVETLRSFDCSGPKPPEACNREQEAKSWLGPPVMDVKARSTKTVSIGVMMIL